MRSFLSYLTTRGERWQKVKEYQLVKCRRTLPADTCISAMTSRNMTHAKGCRDCAKIDALLAVKQGPCTDEGIGLGRSSIRQATLTLAPRMPALLLWRGQTDGSRPPRRHGLPPLRVMSRLVRTTGQRLHTVA